MILLLEPAWEPWEETHPKAAAGIFVSALSLFLLDPAGSWLWICPFRSPSSSMTSVLATPRCHWMPQLGQTMSPCKIFILVTSRSKSDYLSIVDIETIDSSTLIPCYEKFSSPGSDDEFELYILHFDTLFPVKKNGNKSLDLIGATNNIPMAEA